MTIYTKQNLDNDEKKEVAVLDLEVKVEKPLPAPVQRSTALRQADAGISRHLREQRRKRLCIQFFLLFGILLGLSITLLGTLYLYKSKSPKTYSGWCGVRYTARHQAQSGTEGPTDSPSTASAHSYLDEQVTIEEMREILDVPQFDDNDKATFVLDFYQEITLIQDDTHQVCYIMPLDTEKIPPPSSLLELFLRYQGGDFTPDAEEVREDYRVVKPKLEVDEVMQLYGEFIASRCASYDTYQLIHAPEESTTTPTTTTVSDKFFRRYGMYAGGDYLLQFNIDIEF